MAKLQSKHIINEIYCAPSPSHETWFFYLRSVLRTRDWRALNVSHFCMWLRIGKANKVWRIKTNHFELDAMMKISCFSQASPSSLFSRTPEISQLPSSSQLPVKATWSHGLRSKFTTTLNFHFFEPSIRLFGDFLNLNILSPSLFLSSEYHQRCIFLLLLLLLRTS